MTRKVKVGDKLRFTKSEVNGAVEEIGTIVEVVDLISDHSIEVTATSTIAPCSTWWIHEDFIGNGLEFVDDEITTEDIEQASITAKDVRNAEYKPPYIFKVGDKGKTDHERDFSYKITAIGERCLLAEIYNSVYLLGELQFYISGKSTVGKDGYNLLPPTKRIQGWVNVYDDGEVTFFGGTLYPAKGDALEQGRAKDRLACIYIDIEEGEGIKNMETNNE